MSRQLLGHHLPERVAVAFPGPIDAAGRILAAPTVWGDRSRGPVAIAGALATLWPTARVTVVNDVTAAGYRYLSRPDEDLCIVTVSSGIGHKVFLQGRPVIGPSGWGGEIGHVQVDFADDATLCDCGRQGHLGAVASGRGSLFQASRLAALAPEAFARSQLGCEVQGDLERVDNTAIVKAFHQGDAWTVNLVRRMARPLGQVLATIERFIMVGGFALALGAAYRMLLAEAAASCCWSMSGSWDEMVVLGQSDDDAGLIGAARLVTLYASQIGP
ncbi:ROK family protein [Candidatus Entotheonella serta]|nr:ROK family protein [Candidatus Entotheonella serta]